MEDVCAPNGGIEPMNRRERVQNSTQGHLTRCKQRAWTKRGRGVDIERFVLQHERCRDWEKGNWKQTGIHCSILDSIRRRVDRKRASGRVMTSNGFVASVGSGGETRNGAS